MGPTHKRLLLLCGASALALQVAAAPFGFDGDGPGPMIRAAHAWEQSCFTAGTMILMADGTERPISRSGPATWWSGAAAASTGSAAASAPGSGGGVCTP